MQNFKNWEDLTIADNFIFGGVMVENPDLCCHLLEEIIGFKIEKINYLEREKSIETRIDSKGIRLDVLARTPDGQKYFDIEMQVADEDDLAKRMRYYQSAIDIDSLEKGNRYHQLAESYIIFICHFDPFKQGRYKYTFRNRCDEDNNLILADGATKIVLNTLGKLDDVDGDLLEFLRYTSGKKTDNEFVKKIDIRVDLLKHSKIWRNDYMRLQQLLYDTYDKGVEQGIEQGIEKGIEQGIEKGKRENTIEMVKNFLNAGASVEMIIKATGWTEEQIHEVVNN